VYKVLIVDDEPLMRKGLKTVIKWEECGCFICGEAGNVEEGSDAICRLKPDIVITDIKMYDLSGLDMLEQCGEMLKESKLIVVTGYREFDHAKKALNLNVFGFLLKPIDLNEMTSVVKKAVYELDLQKENRLKADSLKKSVDGTLFVQQVKLSAEKFVYAAEESRIDDIEDAREKIKTLCNNFLKEKKYSKIIYKYIFYTLIETFGNFIDKEEYFRTFEMSNIDRIIDNSDDLSEFNDLVELILGSMEKRASLPVDGECDQKISIMLKYIDENYAGQITLDDLAQLTFVSYNYASKIFKNAVGKSFLDYLNYVRIEKAKLLCKDLQYKDYEIGQLVGISNAYYFSKLFKKYVGATVTEYRKNIVC